jgi:hypothetical protein
VNSEISDSQNLGLEAVLEAILNYVPTKEAEAVANGLAPSSSKQARLK